MVIHITRRPSRLLMLGGFLLAGAIAGCGGVSYGGNHQSTTTSGQQAPVRQAAQQQAPKPSPSAVKTHSAKATTHKVTHTASSGTPAVAVAPQPTSGQHEATMPSHSSTQPSPSAVKPHRAKTSAPKTTHSAPAVAPKTTHSAPTVAATQQPKSEIPQNNGGDADPDNNGAPSDRDGGI